MPSPGAERDLESTSLPLRPPVLYDAGGHGDAGGIADRYPDAARAGLNVPSTFGHSSRNTRQTGVRIWLEDTSRKRLNAA
jgi:hypothetical protein